MNGTIPPEIKHFLPEILDQAKNGITITDPTKEDNPIIYANKSFCDIFEYSNSEIIGRNCRFLQKEDREQSGIKLIRKAIKDEVDITVTLRNYTKSGVLKYVEVTITPIFDDTEKLKFFLGIQKDVTSEHRLLQQIKGLI